MLRLFLFFLQLWDLSQRRETRKYSHQSEMRHYRDLFDRNVNGLLLTHTQFQISLAAKWSEAWRLWLMSERVLQAPAHRVYIHALVQSSRVPPHWWILQLKDGHLECWLCLLWDHEVPLRGKGSVFHLLYLNRTAAHGLKTGFTWLHVQLQC